MNNRSEIYIPASARKPDQQYFECARKHLPDIWRLKQEYFWTYAIPPIHKQMIQGWKIHISATPESALRILNKVIPVLVKFGLDFKFASDVSILRDLLSKNCARQLSGKFITIYPKSVSSFKEALENLHSILEDEVGPYILSDRQYKNSKVIFYRYGGFQSLTELNVDGSKKHCILNDSFQYVEDVRSASFCLPDFINDDLIEDVPKNDSEIKEDYLFGSKYKISAVIKHSNAGGVYLAEDFFSKQTTLIKEARPFIGINKFGTDAVKRLKKEFRILTKVSGQGIAPEPYGLFQEWDHYFLAQEFLEGVDLRSFSMQAHPFLKVETSVKAMKIWLENFVKISIQLIEKTILLHKNNIVFGDISLNNVIVNKESLDIKFIDFEGAYEAGVDEPINMFTPGFGSLSRADRETIGVADDYFALGSAMLAMLAPNFHLIEIKDDFVECFLAELQRDIGLPRSIAECIMHLYSSDCMDLDYPLQKLRATTFNQVHECKNESSTSATIVEYCTRVIDELFEYKSNVIDMTADARLFPVGANLNYPLALNNGMLGIAYAWKKIKSEIPQEFEMWIQKKLNVNCDLPGLLNGNTGVAWILAELGNKTAACSALRAASENRLLFQKMNLGYGAAGYGLCNLMFWRKYNDDLYLDEAKKIADYICEIKISDERGCTWEDINSIDGAGIGLYEGSSGIALFLLYMYCACLNETYLKVGAAALNFDISHQVSTKGAISFPRRSSKKSKIIYPYLAYGTAGIASVALRYYAVTQHQQYLQCVNDFKSGISHKYTIGAGLFLGLAGLGNYMLDAYQFLGDSSYLTLAYRVCDGIRLFEISKEKDQIYFPMLIDNKANTDYSDGSSGIALFLNRLLTNGGNFNFMMDDLVHEVVSSKKDTHLQSSNWEH
ncbi:class III lanthionine synthetase LanKC [Undibacterium crateris]|uniref:class III lanthionine synthetase LanKC n=1 Tax=Undibacterium crateris TaxID=2528175 RepID=UPI0013896179|nr:class III lanthionine synthetase LanKC [Undibacterium crateris]NDI85486.1 hypothetical protein [Undibacterium crateris]